MDEPTNGLDTAGIIKLKEYILNSKKRNCITVISSHVMDFVKSICDKNIYLKMGKIVVIANLNVSEKLIITGLPSIFRYSQNYQESVTFQLQYMISTSFH